MRTLISAASTICCSFTAVCALYPCTNPNPTGIGRDSIRMTRSG